VPPLIRGVSLLKLRRLPHVLPHALIRAEELSDSAGEISQARFEFAPADVAEKAGGDDFLEVTYCKAG
jgi:hypothetical protein